MKTHATKAAVLMYSALHETSQRKPQRGNTWRLVGWLDSTFELTLSGKSAKNLPTLLADADMHEILAFVQKVNKITRKIYSEKSCETYTSI